ncbi:MAG: hypothetical protein J6S14_15525 [Clostridia bacterium]|nr:hypothetical protein [Clostridia bacterium]
MSKYGLTKQRYDQMMRLCENDEHEVELLVKAYGAESCNRGYEVFDYDCTGLLCIEKIDDIDVFECDADAAIQAAADGIAIIPKKELPDELPADMKFYGWIDTPENRAKLIAYTK